MTPTYQFTGIRVRMNSHKSTTPFNKSGVMAAEQLRQILQTLKRRAAWIRGTSGVMWGVAIGLLCLIAGVWLDLLVDFPPLLRMLTLAVAGLAAITVIAFLVIRRTDERRLAGQLDEVGNTGGQIRSGVDLCDVARNRTSVDRSQVSEGLAEMAVSRAAGLAANVPRRDAVPARPVKRSLTTLAAIAAVLVMFAVFSPRLFATAWQRFFDPTGDHPPFSQVAIEVEPKGASVVYGSGLDIHATVSGPAVDGLQLVLSKDDPADTEVLPMFPESEGKWRASLTNVKHPLRYFVRTGKTRSRRYDLDVITVPKIERVTFRVTPPEYTRQPVYDGPLPQAGITGLAGTQVEVRVRSNRPLSGGRVRFTANDESTDTALAPAPDDPRQVTGGFSLTESGRIDVIVTDTAEQDSQEPFSANVTKLIDEYPFVRLLQPKGVSFATPTAVVPAVLSAEDDYGITALKLFRSLNDSRALPLDLPVANPPSPRAYEVFYLRFAEYGLEPGDEIKLFARVVDNDPSAQPGPGKGSESSIVVIRIISQAAFDQMQRRRDGLKMLTPKYEQVRRRMESLAEQAEELRKKLEKEPGDEALKKELRQELERLMKQMQNDVETLRKQSEQKQPYELDKVLSPQLKQLADQLQRLIKNTKSAADKNATNKQSLKALQEMLKQLKGERERLDSEMMMPLDMLRKVLPLTQSESRFAQLYRRQRELANRLESLKGKDGLDDPALKRRMRDLEEEQRGIRKELDKLLEDIETAANQLPEDARVEKLRKTALEFVTAVRGSGAAEAMGEAESGLAEFSGTKGHAGAKKAADILEKFLKKCRNMGANGQAGQCLSGFAPSLDEALQQTLGQLLGDAGMNPGRQTGMGQGGSGGGYSTRRNTMQNVGLYGGQPTAEQQQPTRPNMGRSETARAGNGQPGVRRRVTATTADDYRTTGAFRASGGGETVVPLPYRRKVARYFQRIADEVGED